MSQKKSTAHFKIIIMNPTYKISGTERRKLKKELAILKRYVRYFWYYHQLDKDMYFIHGCDSSKLMTDEEARKKVDKALAEISEIEKQLCVLHGA